MEVYCPICKDELEQVGSGFVGVMYYCHQCELEFKIETINVAGERCCVSEVKNAEST